MAKHSFNKTVWQCLTLISQFGIMMLVPTGMMFALGYWLDGRLGTQFFAIVLFLLAFWRDLGIFIGWRGKFIRRRTKRTGNEKFFQKIDETVREMWLGTFLWGCLCELVSVWWVKDRLYSGLGILIGMLLAMAGIWHMWKVLDTALELGDGAQKYATSKNLLRYAVVLVVFAVLMLTHFADPLAAFAGLMGMKASAYLQPFIRGYKEKKRR